MTSAARDWVSGMPASGLQQRLFASISSVVARENGQAAAELAATQLQPGMEQDRVTVSIVQQWGQTSPAAAAAWVEQFPQGTLQAAAAENLAAIWTAQDSETAARWLATLPEGPLREAAVSGSAKVVAGAVFR